jgi:hypothetical protein
LAPKVAEACNGNACSDSAYSATTPAYNSSDKKVSTVLTNKSSTQSIHLKFCIMVDGKCNSFDVTLPPHGSTMKSVSLSGATAFPKFTVEVTNADFPNTQATTTSPASPTPAGVVTIDAAPYGKITYFANQQALVGTGLTRGVADFIQARTSYQNLMPRVFKLRENAQKLPSPDAVKAESRKKYNASPTLQVDAVRLDEIKRNGQTLNVLYRLVTTNASQAAENLLEAENQMQAAAYRDKAAKLIAEAEKERQTLLTIISVISIAKGSTGDDLTAVGLSAAEKVVDVLTNAGELTAKANDLQQQAEAIEKDFLPKKFKSAQDALTRMKTSADEVRTLIANTKTDYAKAVQKQQQDFDQPNAAGKPTFQIENLNALILEARGLQKLAAETAGTAKTAQLQLASVRSANGNWMADANGDIQVIQQISNLMVQIKGEAELAGRDVDSTLAKLEQVSAAATQAQQ